MLGILDGFSFSLNWVIAMKKDIHQELLVQIAAVVPPDAEVVPLNFQYEDEDYNIAVFVSEHIDGPTLQGRLYDLIFTYVASEQPAGRYEVRFEAGVFREVRQMLLLR